MASLSELVNGREPVAEQVWIGVPSAHAVLPAGEHLNGCDSQEDGTEGDAELQG